MGVSGLFVVHQNISLVLISSQPVYHHAPLALPVAKPVEVKPVEVKPVEIKAPVVTYAAAPAVYHHAPLVHHAVVHQPVVHQYTVPKVTTHTETIELAPHVATYTLP